MTPNNRTSELRPVPDPVRVQFTDANGMLTRDGYYFLLTLYVVAVNSETTAVLEAFDSGTEFALLPAIQDASKEAQSDGAADHGAAIEELRKAQASDGPAPQVLDELRNLVLLESPAAGPSDDLQKLIWALVDPAGTSGVQLISDTHANRGKYPAAAYASALYYETDRHVLYETLSGSWTFVAGDMAAVFANRPTDLGTHDVGFLFAATDTQNLYVWTGAAWVLIGTGVAGTTFTPTLRVAAGSTSVVSTDFTVVSNNTTAVAFSLIASGGTSLAANQTVVVKNKASSLGIVSLTVSTGGTIDGASSLSILPGQSYWLQFDGTNFIILAAYAPATSPGAWTAYTPTFTADGGVTVTAANLTCAYFQWGKLMFVRVGADLTLSAATSTRIHFTVPPPGPATDGEVLTVSAIVSGLGFGCTCLGSTAQIFAVETSGGGATPFPVAVTLRATGVFETL